MWFSQYSSPLSILFWHFYFDFIYATVLIWTSILCKLSQHIQTTKINKRTLSFCCCFFLFCFFDIFIDYAITVVPFPPLHSTPSGPPPPSHIPPHRSCPWVILISSLASTFPTLFLPSPCLFSTYHLCYLFSVPFPPLSPSHSPVDNPPCDIHFCGSVPVLVVCLVFFCFGFKCVC